MCGENVSYAQFLFYDVKSAFELMEVHNISAKELSINEEIRIKEVRVVSDNGEQLGVMSSAEALDKAYAKGLDLVLIAPGATPPVCRIMDYGKFRYERDKKEKEAKKKQQTIETKEVQLSCRIDTHDFNTKANNAIRFLKGGDKVRVVLLFRGREMAHIGSSAHVLDDFAAMLEDIAQVSKSAKLEGRNMTMFLEKKR